MLRLDVDAGDAMEEKLPVAFMDGEELGESVRVTARDDVMLRKTVC
jgi:hypothetical protein